MHKGSITGPKTDQNSCFWLKNSNVCAHTTRSAVVIVVALSAIAVVSGVLLLLASQGYNLGGINSIAAQVGQKGIYKMIIAGGTLFILDIVVITLMIRSHLNKSVSEKELKSHGVIDHINKEHIREQMRPSTYWELDPKDFKST